jgi:hypothetical protein
MILVTLTIHGLVIRGLTTKYADLGSEVYSDIPMDDFRYQLLTLNVEIRNWHNVTSRDSVPGM